MGSIPGPNDSLPSRISVNDMYNVEGMVVVVTGGGSGIGLTMARALEHNGAVVYTIGRRLSVLERAAKDNSLFGNIIPLHGDVTNSNDLLSAVELIKARHGYIDLLVNNAGIVKNLYSHPLPSPLPTEVDRPLTPSGMMTPPGSPQVGSMSSSASVPSIKAFQASLWDTGSPDDFADVFATNVTAPYYTTVAFLDLLHQGNIRKLKKAYPSGNSFDFSRPPYHSSQVLTVSSSGAFRLDTKILSMSYTLSKCASTHLGKVLANLLAPWGIRSNIIAPGVWPSEMTTSALSDASANLDPVVLAQDVPLKRTGTDEDMAGVILFLASRAGAYMNGSVFVADGGRSNAYLGGGASSQF